MNPYRHKNNLRNAPPPPHVKCNPPPAPPPPHVKRNPPPPPPPPHFMRNPPPPPPHVKAVKRNPPPPPPLLKAVKRNPPPPPPLFKAVKRKPPPPPPLFKAVKRNPPPPLPLVKAVKLNPPPPPPLVKAVKCNPPPPPPLVKAVKRNPPPPPPPLVKCNPPPPPPPHVKRYPPPPPPPLPVKKYMDGKRTVKVYYKAKPDYVLTIRADQFVLARSNPSGPNQLWIKFGTSVKDEQGHVSFVLVNKATGQAMKYSFMVFFPVRLTKYNPHTIDESVLWTKGNDLGDGYRAVRRVNNIKHHLDAFNGDKKPRWHA